MKIIDVPFTDVKGQDEKKKCHHCKDSDDINPKTDLCLDCSIITDRKKRKILFLFTGIIMSILLGTAIFLNVPSNILIIPFLVILTALVWLRPKYLQYEEDEYSDEEFGKIKNYRLIVSIVDIIIVVVLFNTGFISIVTDGLIFLQLLAVSAVAVTYHIK